ncbi:HIT family protein [Psychrobacillus sp. FSL K6-2365]|uniref:HIT family protein n=1 Tax=Psychrobacillus sp. FSL K6-2365 TaxID=2921546 RepID=UPI0030F90121
MENYIFCKPQRDVKQNIVFENNTCYFLKHDNEKQILVGCGVVVPKVLHINVFELTKEVWNDTYEMLHKAKEYLGNIHSPDGYTIGWNVA